MKDITIINQDSGYLMIDIANSFVNEGYRTTLIAGRVVQRDNPLDEKIKLIKIKKYNRKSNLHKVQSWILGAIQIFFLILIRYRKTDLLLVSNPPFAPLLPYIIKCNYSILIFDLYPDALVEYGILKMNSRIIKLWTYLNLKVFKRARNIYTLTKGMKSGLERYVSPDKIEIVPLWSSDSFLKPIEKENNPFIKKHHLDGKFVILYSGNFGSAHQIDLIVKLMSKIKDPKIVLLLIGGGPAENNIRQMISSLGITNCLMLPWQGVDVLPFSLSAADLSIVSLSDNASQVAIPSKLLSYMAVGSPILGISGKGSDLEKMILDYNIGKSFTSKQFDDILQFIEFISKNPEQCLVYKKNSIEALKHHTIKNVDLITKNHV